MTINSETIDEILDYNHDINKTILYESLWDYISELYHDKNKTNVVELKNELNTSRDWQNFQKQFVTFLVSVSW